jgi:hypothetical protein
MLYVPVRLGCSLHKGGPPLDDKGRTVIARLVKRPAALLLVSLQVHVVSYILVRFFVSETQAEVGT